LLFAELNQAKIKPVLPKAQNCELRQKLRGEEQTMALTAAGADLASRA